MHAMIATGTDRYADPWHPFTQTSPLIAEILRDAGFSTQIDEDVDHALTQLDGVDLLVVNAGDPWRNSDAALTDLAPSRAGFTAALERGMGILGFHCAVASLRDYAEGAAALGAMWIPTLSYHPPASDTTITVLDLPDGTSLAPFDLFDERYCRLQRLAHTTVVAKHEGDGSPEPAAWVHEVRSSRIAVDVLGHDERSYESPGHRELIRRLAVWAADRD